MKRGLNNRRVLADFSQAADPPVSNGLNPHTGRECRVRYSSQIGDDICQLRGLFARQFDR